jgi:Family of unknown function (DUF6459)
MQQISSKPVRRHLAGRAESVRQLVVPQVAPPYDDEAGTTAAAGRHDRHQEGNGGWLVGAAASSPSPRAAQPEPARPVSPQSPDQRANHTDPGGRGAAAGTWPGQFAQVLAETLAGSRPHRQLAPWTTEQVRRQIRQLGPLFGNGERPLVRRVMTAAPASGVLELTAVVGLGPRVRVLALRLERERAGSAWCCTAIESA